ncbi:uncharacterized protein LOC106170171 isoform X2 [Lingula anatina]|uniref:Uncharacterized protein LOC106170171 isoform X2 n=1 Tax=Lingula anatina TaxID=7574 RepID=A0A1S3J6B7_LINAN|nr:uncharacterized protein LOC106170171 isoform X2 [Lingula anatina]|eukprot:XP_013405384.1 uncharacterized protein LOC106170171 isoform X2 [Lingula anatina]
MAWYGKDAIVATTSNAYSGTWQPGDQPTLAQTGASSQGLKSWPQSTSEQNIGAIGTGSWIVQQPAQGSAANLLGVPAQNPRFPAPVSGSCASMSTPPIMNTDQLSISSSLMAVPPVQSNDMLKFPQPNISCNTGVPLAPGGGFEKTLTPPSNIYMSETSGGRIVDWQHSIPNVMPWAARAPSSLSYVNIDCESSLGGRQLQKKRKADDMEFPQPPGKEQATEEKMTARMNELTLDASISPAVQVSETTIMESSTSDEKEKEEQEKMRVEVNISPEVLRSIERDKPLLPRKILEQIMVAELPPSMEMVLWQPPGDFIKKVVRKDIQHRKAANTGRSTFAEGTCPLASEGLPCDFHMADISVQSKGADMLDAEEMENDMDLQ